MLRENLITSSMFQSYRHASFWMLCILFAYFSQVYAQDPIVTQSNDTTTTSPDRQFVLAIAHSGSDAPYNINPLTGAAGLDLDTRDFRVRLIEIQSVWSLTVL